MRPIMHAGLVAGKQWRRDLHWEGELAELLAAGQRVEHDLCAALVRRLLVELLVLLRLVVRIADLAVDERRGRGDLPAFRDFLRRQDIQHSIHSTLRLRPVQRSSQQGRCFGCPFEHGKRCVDVRAKAPACLREDLAS